VPGVQDEDLEEERRGGDGEVGDGEAAGDYHVGGRCRCGFAALTERYSGKGEEE